MGAGKASRTSASTATSKKTATVPKKSTTPRSVIERSGTKVSKPTAVSSKQRSTSIKSNNDILFEKAYTFYKSDDYANSFPLFKTLAEEGYEKAYGYMGLAYELGEGVSVDHDLMVKYFVMAVESGSSWCAYRLGEYYYKKRDYGKALSNYMECGFSKQWSGFRSNALYKAGMMNEKGEGTEINLEQAILCYRESAKQSNSLYSDARSALKRLGVPLEMVEDFVDATPAMIAGLSAKAMYEKGSDYESGWSNQFSLTKAYAYYKASADAGYAKACVKMGEIFVSSSYPFNDKAKSNSYYQKAISAYKQIEGSNGEACYELGRIYQYGKGVKANIEQAKYYYKVGASLGEKNASWRYGLICKDQKSYYEAFTFFLKAAEAGQGMAMYEVAEMYEKALGVEMSKEKAIEWYLKCEKSNYASASDAKRALRRLGVVENK